jgi:hypothetical protein
MSIPQETSELNTTPNLHEFLNIFHRRRTLILLRDDVFRGS